MEKELGNWLERKDWQNGRIRPRNVHLEFFFLLVFFVLWTAISSIIYLNESRHVHRAIDQLLSSGFQQFDENLIIPAMFLMSLLMLPGLLKYFKKWRKARHISLYMSPYPGEVGGQVGGDLTVPVAYRSDMAVDVRVNCIDVSISKGSSSNNRRHERVRWRNKASVELMPGSNGTLIRFLVNTEPGLPESDIEEKGSHVYWAVRVEVPEHDIGMTFNIPVFAGLSSSTSAYYSSEPDLSVADIDLLPPEIASVKRQADGFVVDYPPGREKKVANVFTVMGMIFTAVAVFMAYQIYSELTDARTSYFVLIVTSMIFLGFSLFGVAMFLGGLYMKTNRLLVEQASAGTRVTRFAFGREFSSFIKSGDVRRIEKKVTTQFGQGAASKIHYSIYLINNDNRKVTIGDGIPKVENMELLLNFFKEHIQTTDGPVIKPDKLPLPAWVPYLKYAVMGFVTLMSLVTVGAFIFDFMR